MTLVVAIGMLRAGGRIRRASFAGYWIISKAGRKRPLPPRIFRTLEERGKIKRAREAHGRIVGVGQEWIWNGSTLGNQPFLNGGPMPQLGPRCKGGS